MSKHDVFMPLMIGDFLRDTMRLDVEQQGAYLLLLIDMWCNGPIKNEEKILQKICKFSAHKWAKKSEEILQIFSVKDGCIFHPDMEDSRERAIATHEARALAGRKGGMSKGKPGHEKTASKTEAGVKHSHSHSHSHSEASIESLSRDSINTGAEAPAPAPDETGGEAGYSGDEQAKILHALEHMAGISPTTPAARLALDHWRSKSVTSGELERAVDIARTYKPTGRIPLNYLKTIIEDQILNPENRHARRSNPAEKLSPSEIILAAARDEANAGILEGECEIIH